MQTLEVFEEARTKSRSIALPHPPEIGLEALRQDCGSFFSTVPEPPVYLRAEDPLRAMAKALLPEAVALLARAYASVPQGREVRAMPDADALLTAALEHHVAALCHTAEGRLTPAEQEFQKARATEREARNVRRAWHRDDEDSRPVFDAARRVSRYDPRPDPTVRVRLFCTNLGCKKPSDFAFSPTFSTHRFVCAFCQEPFTAFFGELRELKSQDVFRQHRYDFRLDDLGGGASRVTFDDANADRFTAARGDLLAFLYSTDRALCGLYNLTTSRMLWVTRGGPCFVATAAFGERAPELTAFRAFRDEALMPHALGRAFVTWYYARGPVWAERCTRHPWRKTLTRRALRTLHRVLVRHGFSS